jgi:hypothetical protein
MTTAASMTRHGCRISRLGGVCLGIAAIASAGDARGGSSARLVYARAPEASSCPDEVALRNAVAARLGYDPFFPWAKQTFVVQVWRENRRYRARLQLVDAEGLAHGTRGFASDQPTCAELFDTAALAISIAMDSLPKDEPPAASVVPPLPPPTPAPDIALEATPTPAPLVAPLPPPTSASEPPIAPRSPSATRVALGVDALGVIGSEPAPTAAFAAFAGLHSRSASASVELRADLPAGAASAVGPGRVRVWSYQTALVTCARRRAASLCALGSVGLLYAESSGITDPRSDSGFFVTAGARAGFEWPLSDRFSFRAHLDALVDLRRVRLQIGGADAWLVPIVAGSGGAGIAANFE